MSAPQQLDLAGILQVVRRRGQEARSLTAIAGAPGSGKSTLAEAVVARLNDEAPDSAAVLPMDGYHFDDRILVPRGLRPRKGAPDTFDARGFAALLRRLRAREDSVVYAPEFRREIEEPVACAVPVPRGVPLVVTEGNYLLVDDADWSDVRALLDEAWYVEGDEDRRRDWLIARHIQFGKAPEFAREWVMRSDERNAELVATTRTRADLVVRVG